MTDLGCHHEPTPNHSGFQAVGAWSDSVNSTYQLMHHVRERVEGALGEGMSLRRLRERVLKVATQVVRHSRRIYFRISASKATLWRVVARALAPPGLPGALTEGTAA